MDCTRKTVIFTRFSRENPVILLGECICENRATLVPKSVFPRKTHKKTPPNTEAKEGTGRLGNPLLSVF
jgi:hypothetical protein